jgi:hypothetical protein
MVINILKKKGIVIMDGYSDRRARKGLWLIGIILGGIFVGFFVLAMILRYHGVGG